MCIEQTQIGYLEGKQGKEAQTLKCSSSHILSLVHTCLVTHILLKHTKVTATSRRTNNNHCSGSEILPRCEIMTVAVLTQMNDKGFRDNDDEQTDRHEAHKSSDQNTRTRLIQLRRAT